MAKVFVSATYVDLKEYREQVERVIRRMGHEDVAMEYYVAEDQRPVAKCLADVAACDVYVGIFAWRYGWVPKTDNPNGWSITEMEYRRAEELKKPCLIFLLDGKAPWPPDFIDDDKTQIKRLRNELSEKHSTGPGFRSADELGRLVAEAIHKWERDHGLTVAPRTPEYNLEAYYNALRERYGFLALEGLTPPQKEEYLQIQLRSVFAEQNVRENPPPVELPKEVWEKLRRDKDIHPEDLPSGITLDDVRKAREGYYEKPSRPVLDVLTDARFQHSIILGDPGSGKSTLARYVMLSLVDPWAALPGGSLQGEKLRAFDGYLPVLIELRAYAALFTDSGGSTFLEFLEYLGRTEGWALTQAALNDYLKSDGRAVVVFDGLDEIFDAEKRERITKQIVAFAGDYPRSRIIVTSRVIGYQRKILTDAGFTHFTLQDLDEKQVETFVSRWFDLAMSERPGEAKERRERILRSFKESASIRQLAGNPMLLTIMAIIGKHQELPRERWKLYDHAASVLIQHWDVNKHLKGERIEADFIGEDDKKDLLRRLAFRMQSGEGGLAGNYIRRDQLHAEFESYLRERYSQTRDRATVIAEAMIQQFRERSFILSLYGVNLYGFVNRAFLEYFCASAFVYKFEKTKELTIEQLKNHVYGKYWDDQSWREVLRLICGMIDEKWAGEIIDHLTNNFYRPLPQEFGNRSPWNISLAVQCLGEIRDPSSISVPAANLLQVVCSLFDHCMANYIRLEGTFEEELLFAIETIGTDWPRRWVVLEDWLKKRKSYDGAFLYTKQFGVFVGSIGKGLDGIYKALIRYTKHVDRNFRILAPSALMVGWSDSLETISLIDSIAKSDAEQVVRNEARRIISGRRVQIWLDWLNGVSSEDQLEKLSLPDGGTPSLRAHKLRLRDIRVFVDSGEISLQKVDELKKNPGILFLGDNAAGKTTLLRCIALSTLGSELANQVERRPESYLRFGAERGLIEVSFQLYLDGGVESVFSEFCVGMEIRAGENSFRAMQSSDLTLGEHNAITRLNSIRRRTDDRFGFVCGYGPLRTLSENPSGLQAEEPKDTLERVVSLFRPSTSLMDPDVLSRMLSGDLSNFRDAPSGQLDPILRSKIIAHLEDILSGVEVASIGPELTMYGVPVSLRDLSDGYNSFVALVGHLFRHALTFKSWKDDPVDISGILLIDEVDLHLHPAWQRRVMRDLSRVFPNLQIIATSHSAMVAGSVHTDSIIVLRREGNEIIPYSDLRSVVGMRADQILTSELFELATTRSIDAEELMNKYAELLSRRGPGDPDVKELGRRVSETLNMVGEGTVDEYTHLLLQKFLEQQFISLDEATRRLVLAKAELMLSDARGRK